MPKIWMVRLDHRTYTTQCLSGGYAGIGWLPDDDLSEVTDLDFIRALYPKAHPHDKSEAVIRQQVGQIGRFLLEIQAGDYVVTPTVDNERLHFGQVVPDPSYYYSATDDGCPYRHRRKVIWDNQELTRSEFSVPFQNTIRSSLTIFAISHRDEFFAKIGKLDLVSDTGTTESDPYRVVLDQILSLDAKEFEILVAHLLTALGFEGSEVTEKSGGDGGVDAIGELSVANLASVKIFVQAKRYKPGTKISAVTVRNLRGSIPGDGQGAFITTADFGPKAYDVAVEPKFPHISLINGHQLVDLLVEHWNDIPPEFRDLLGLKPGLVLS